MKFSGKPGFLPDSLAVSLNDMQIVCHTIASFWNYSVDKLRVYTHIEHAVRLENGKPHAGQSELWRLQLL